MNIRLIFKSKGDTFTYVLTDADKEAEKKLWQEYKDKYLYKKDFGAWLHERFYTVTFARIEAAEDIHAIKEYAERLVNEPKTPDFFKERYRFCTAECLLKEGSFQ